MRQIFVSEDGRQFNSAQECDIYEQMHDVRTKIKAWAESAYNDKQGQSTRAYNLVVDWETVRDEVLSKPTPVQEEAA